MTFRFLLPSTALVLLSLLSSLRADPGPLLLWYTNAAVDWKDTLPIGNGKLAAMVYGGITSDEIEFNEDTIWTGQPHDYAHAGASNSLAQIRSLIFATNGIAAWSVAQANFMSSPLRQCAYQPGGDLRLTFAHTGATNYRRWLDLDTATASLQYDLAGTTYLREVFASYPDKVIVVRLTASQPGKITFSCSFATPHASKTITAVGNDLVLHGSVANAANGLTSSVQFEARVRVLNEGGTVAVNGSTLNVTNADAVTLLLSIASNVLNYDDVSGNAALLSSNALAAAATKAYPALRQAQLDDYQKLFRRVVLDLGTSTRTNIPTNIRIPAVRTNSDPQLMAVLFQMGRYLMISGSRPGSEPLNLQGKWNNTLAPNWESKMTLNINEEMNYWAAEVANLAECHQPLFDMITDLSFSGRSVARTHYNADGWVAHHNTDLWRGAGPINGQDGIWPTGGAWLCQHLWWHYEFSGDTHFLATVAYPVMKGAAEFFKDFLVPDPRHPLWRVTNPTHSPEQGNPAFGDNGNIVAGPTMDNQLIRDLFNNVIQAGEILGVDAAWRTNLAALRDQLPPNQIGKFGQLQEWLEDVDEPNNGHRHMSPLVGLFPGEEITALYTPTIAAAAKVLVDWRGDAPNEKGWSKAWRMCLRNRLQDSNRAYLLLTNAVSRNVSANMTYNASDQQIDAVFGLTMGIVETLLQSQSGEIFLLPSLPVHWASGSVSNLCARGGFDVDIQWQSNRLTRASLRSKLGKTGRIRSKWPLEVKQGTNNLNAPMILPGLYEFSTVAGVEYTLVPAAVIETESLTALTSTGDTHQFVTNSAFSNGRGTMLNANAAGDFVNYTITNVPAGNYRLCMVANARTNGGQFQLAIGPISGVPLNVGSVQDTFSPTNFVTLFTTNLLREFDCGAWTATTNGDYTVQFRVQGKNAASSGYQLQLDYLRLIPMPALPAASTLAQWRSAKFGNDSNNSSIAGDEADPDHDGLKNLLEYALSRNPLVSDATNLMSALETAGYLTLTYQRSKTATDISVQVEVKTALTDDWTTNVQPPVVTDDGNGATETVRIRDTVPMTDVPHRFMRLKAMAN